MKLVKSTDALQRLALVRGAGATVGGQSFNSTMDKITPVSVKQPEPDPEPEPPAPVVQTPPEIRQEVIVQDALPAVKASIDSMNAYAAKAEVISQTIAKTLEHVVQIMGSAGTQQEPQKQWTLSVVRDSRGVMQSIDIVQK